MLLWLWSYACGHIPFMGLWETVPKVKPNECGCTMRISLLHWQFVWDHTWKGMWSGGAREYYVSEISGQKLFWRKSGNCPHQSKIKGLIDFLKPIFAHSMISLRLSSFTLFYSIHVNLVAHKWHRKSTLSVKFFLASTCSNSTAHKWNTPYDKQNNHRVR